MKVVYIGTETVTRVQEHWELFEKEGIHFEERLDIGLEDADGIVAACAGADAVITVVHPFTAEVINRLDASVKAISRIAIGYEIIDVEACTRRGILVSNCPDYGANEVAVHTAALILSAVRKTSYYDKKVRQGCYQKMGYTEGFLPHRLSEQTLGVIGFGRIGQAVASYMKAFGMKILAYDAYLPDDVFRNMDVERADSMEAVLTSADILTFHCPLTKETHHLVNKTNISKMRDGVILVNTSRGPIVEQAALVQGLRTGKITAAGLDVFEKEPFCDQQDELLSFENVVLTPHIAYLSAESSVDLKRKSAEIAIAGAKGEVPYSCVNRRELDR